MSFTRYIYSDDVEPDEALESGRLARKAFKCEPDESCGYDQDDPKHPDFHDNMADLWDLRERG